MLRTLVEVSEAIRSAAPLSSQHVLLLLVVVLAELVTSEERAVKTRLPRNEVVLCERADNALMPVLVGNASLAAVLSSVRLCWR